MDVSNEIKSKAAFLIFANILNPNDIFRNNRHVFLLEDTRPKIAFLIRELHKNVN